MKKINEMTEQEILVLSEKDIQNMIKFRMMEEGIKVLTSLRNPNYLKLSLLTRKFMSFLF